MNSSRTTTVIASVLAKIRRDGLLEGAAEAARDAAPAMAALPRLEILRHVTDFFDAMSDPDLNSIEPDPAGIAAAEALGSVRAGQGVPLEAMLAGFDAAKSYTMRAILERCLAAGAREQSLLRMLLNVDAQMSALQLRVIQAFRSTELDLAWTDREVQTQALRLLLRGETMAAHDVGMDPERRHRCLAVDVRSGREAREVEAALSYTEGVFGTVDGYFCGVVRWEPKPTDIDKLVVVSPLVPLAELASTSAVCLRALEVAKRRGLGGVHRLTDLALGVAVDGYAEMGVLLAAENFDALDPVDTFHRQLAVTALVYFEHGCRVDRAAAELQIHPNTVKYRLRRLGALTTPTDPGRMTSQLGHIFASWWGLSTWLEVNPDPLDPLDPLTDQG